MGIQHRFLGQDKGYLAPIVKSCVKSCSSIFEYFSYSIGLRQGDVVVPDPIFSIHGYMERVDQI